MSKFLPIYSIDSFKKELTRNEFYANNFSDHVKEHHFTNFPHKHDFFLVVLVTNGSGWHEVDFVRYNVKPGSVFTLQPGQMHFWELSKDIDGFVFFHTKSFYEEANRSLQIHDFPFYASFQSNKEFSISNEKVIKLQYWMSEIIEETTTIQADSRIKIRTLIDLIYIELSRDFVIDKNTQKHNYLDRLKEFEKLIESNYKVYKSAQFYADKLNVSTKHLNRIVKDSINKTSSELIADRVILEAKRLLIQSNLNVSEIGYALGYFDKSYFVRFFKKQTGETPLTFLEKYNKAI
jgi:hypothetical protein